MNTIFDWLESKKIPYTDKELIRQALVHSSYVNGRVHRQPPVSDSVP